MPSAHIVSTNSSESVRPAGNFSAGNWASSVFGSFGGPIFNKYWGTNGAIIWCLTGGHLSASNVGLLIYDCDTNLFSFQACTNASFVELNSTGVPADWSDVSTSGSPYFEITGVTGPCPTPTHTYATMAAINQGTKGKILFLCRQSTCQQSDESAGCHVIDPTTGVWARFTASQNDMFSSGQGDGTAIYDEAGAKIYSFSVDFQNFAELHYLDLGTTNFTDTATSGPGGYTFPPSMTGGSFSMDTTRRWLLAHDDTSNDLLTLDLANITAGWNPVTVTGTLDTPDHSLWCFFPPDGHFYRLPGTGGNTLQRLALTSLTTATVDTITLTGDAVPSYTDGGNVLSAPYRSLMYVPALQKMIWAVGSAAAIAANSQVLLIDPSAGAQNPYQPWAQRGPILAM